MLIKRSCIALLALLFLSCHLREKETPTNSVGPKVVEAHGYVVPADSMAVPKVIVVDESKLIKIPAGKPKVVPANTNVHPAGIPKVVIAGTPRLCTPGQDTFSLPVTVPAIDSPFVAGVPEIVVVKDAFVKDQNPQNFSAFGKLQGLKHSAILCMLQDQAGNLWIGTWGGGVSRYDGKSFTHFTTEEGLSNSIVGSILEDQAGNLWFGTWGGGVNRYDGKSFTHFTEKEGLSNNVVLSILEDHDGNIWFGTRGGGVNRYEPPKETQVGSFTHFTVKEGISDNDVGSILEDRTGNLWFGTYTGGVSRYNGQSFTHFTTEEGLSNNAVGSILEDRAGNLWFGTYGGGVNRYDGKSFSHFTEKEGLSNNLVNIIKEDQAGILWFGTNDGGVSKYDGKTFTHFTEKEGLSNNMVFTILEDRTGNLWFGTNGGVSKYGGKSLTHFTTEEGLSNNFVMSVLQDHAGYLWFGTFGSGVSRYKPPKDGQAGSFTHFTEKEGLSNNMVFNILEDRAGNLWFGTFVGVSKYEPPKDGLAGSFTHFTENEGLSNNTVNVIKEDRAGNLWIGTYGGGVSRFDGKSFTHFTEKQGLSNNVVFSILEDHTGNLWFGTRGGVSKYEMPGDGQIGSFTHFTEKQGLSNNVVFSILEDHAGNLWFGTEGGGLSMYEPPGDGQAGSFTHFTEKQGLPNNFVFSTLEDHDGNLWFGTRFGLSELTPINLTRMTDKVRENSVLESDQFFRNYAYEDGFLGIGCNANAIDEDNTGTIWIGANDRLTAYHPPAVEEAMDTNGPNIQITDIALYNEPVPWTFLTHHKDSILTLGNGVQVKNVQLNGTSKWYGLPQELSLAHNNNYVTFAFIGITMSQPKRVKYKYKMEGLDENWSALTTRTEAPYGNLPHGAYTFKVKAMDSEGYWSDEYQYPFSIRPPWWLTWWAYSLYAFVFLTLSWRVLKYQQARTTRIERERTQQRELEHAREIEKAYTDLQATQALLIQSEKMASLGELTAGIAHEIQNPLNFVNNFSEVSNELMDEMTDELNKGELVEAKNIASDIKQNLEKITHHGKRADAIVKGMLQHSRASSGVKEPTDINALADEYLRLAYHGLRAKDKSFNAKMETDFDPSIGSINVVPQDIGRVILNLITNAFYAVTEKKNALTTTPYPLKGGTVFEPTVIITTKKQFPLSGGRGSERATIEISVKDNGHGIPQNVLEKIFQPFFTTKPTGRGTGLGLSLSYDIIAAHGGELKVESKEGEYAEFMIILPTIKEKN